MVIGFLFKNAFSILPSLYEVIAKDMLRLLFCIRPTVYANRRDLSR